MGGRGCRQIFQNHRQIQSSWIQGDLTTNRLIQAAVNKNFNQIMSLSLEQLLVYFDFLLSSDERSMDSKWTEAFSAEPLQRFTQSR